MADKGTGVKISGLDHDGVTFKFLYQSTDDETRKDFERKNNFWNFVEEVLQESDEVLADSDYPALGFVIAHNAAGEWSYLTSNDEKRNKKILTALPEISPSWAFTAEFADAFSKEFYAAVIGNYCMAILPGKKKSERDDDFVSRVYLLGTWLADKEWRDGYKPDILTGTKTRRRLDDARKASIRTAKERALERKTLVAEIAKDTRLKWGALEKRIQRLLETEFDLRVSLRTIRRDLSALRKVNSRKR